MDTTTSFEHFLTTQLNAEQYKAVTHHKGSLLVVAGAGSGKTRVITARIANLMQRHSSSPESIIALTFTNKAAQEMKERVRQLIRAVKLPFVGTFHSYCLRLLKQYYGDATFSIIDQDDQEKMIKLILERHNLNKTMTARQIQYSISQLKNRNIYPQANAELFLKNPLLFDIYQQYEQEKKASKCFDFDDLLLETLALFKKNTDFKKRFSDTIRHILVDEYQDTNVVQHALLKEFACTQNVMHLDSICVVGDGDQSIYSWRGATVTNMRSFIDDFKADIIKIEQNYRSVQPILTIANHLIEHNTQRNDKKLWSNRTSTNCIAMLICTSEYQEADTMVHAINANTKHTPQESIAILYRTHTQSRAIEETLIRSGIPYRIIGGTQFYERAEIKDLLAYLKLIANPHDRVSFMRIINVPNRGLGTKCEELFFDIWSQEPFLNYQQLIKTIGQNNLLPSSKMASLEQFCSIFDDLTSSTAPSIALATILARSSYIAYLKRTCDDEDADARIENIKELLAAIDHFEQQGCSSTQQFLEEIALMQDVLTRTKETAAAVVLMTLHAAKGLEFDTVLFTGLENSILPTPRSLLEPDGIEEERRLMYVGITRARNRILFTSAKNRYNYGSLQRQTISRFIDEMPASNIPMNDCSYWTHQQYNSFFENWFLGTPTTQKSATTFNAYAPSNATIRSTKPTATPAMPESKVRTVATPFTPHQRVKHATYGFGTVQKIEIKDQETYVHVIFSAGTKKILATFLRPA